MSTSGPAGTRIAIVDDHTLFAESLAITFESEGYPVRQVRVSDAGASLATVLSSLLRSRPRVTLLDLDLGHVGDGMRLITPLAEAGVAVVVVTGANERARWGECLRRGAKAVMLKSSPLEELVGAVRRVRDGLPLMTPEDRHELIELAMHDLAELGTVRARLERLTRREQEILGELMHGHQVRDIAKRSVVSEATVRTQVKSILAKLETSSQIAAVGAAHKVGWRPPDD